MTVFFKKSDETPSIAENFMMCFFLYCLSSLFLRRFEQMALLSSPAALQSISVVSI
jgi:hypothetical protein